MCGMTIKHYCRTCGKQFGPVIDKPAGKCFPYKADWNSPTSLMKHHWDKPFKVTKKNCPVCEMKENPKTDVVDESLEVTAGGGKEEVGEEAGMW